MGVCAGTQSLRAVTHRLKPLLELLGVVADHMPIELYITGMPSAADSSIARGACAARDASHDIRRARILQRGRASGSPISSCSGVRARF